MENFFACRDGIYPFIFSLDSKADISGSTSNNAEAHLELCFVPKISDDFFVERDSTKARDKC